MVPLYLNTGGFVQNEYNKPNLPYIYSEEDMSFL